MLLAATCVMTMARLSQGAPPPRAVHVDGQQFALATGEPIILVGPNVVVKGPPYLPSVSGDTFCNDVVNDVCTAAGNCTTCSTFNQADVDHIKQMGWNTIRLGVVWAGAQPEDNGALDPDFVRKLHAILNLTDTAGLHVILDNHGDMVGTAGCGNGVPMWFQQKASPELIGKPLETDLPFKVLPSLRVEELKGYAVCGANATKWARFAGDPNYNLLNECCQVWPAVPAARARRRIAGWHRLLKSVPPECHPSAIRVPSECHPSAIRVVLLARLSMSTASPAPTRQPTATRPSHRRR